MLCIRINDNDKIQGINNIINLSKENRKGNLIKKVQLQNNQLIFESGYLETKMISKNDKEEFNKDIPIKVLITSNNLLIFQDFERLCHFLMLDDDGIINPIKFDDLNPDDEILIYDGQDDYALSTVEHVYYSDVLDINDEERDTNEIKDNPNQLSNYLIFSKESGLIVNDIIII